jgi:hypothetical protein
MVLAYSQSLQHVRQQREYRSERVDLAIRGTESWRKAIVKKLSASARDNSASKATAHTGLP